MAGQQNGIRRNPSQSSQRTWRICRLARSRPRGAERAALRDDRRSCRGTVASALETPYSARALLDGRSRDTHEATCKVIPRFCRPANKDSLAETGLREPGRPALASLAGTVNADDRLSHTRRSRQLDVQQFTARAANGCRRAGWREPHRELCIDGRVRRETRKGRARPKRNGGPEVTARYRRLRVTATALFLERIADAVERRDGVVRRAFGGRERRAGLAARQRARAGPHERFGDVRLSRSKRTPMKQLLISSQFWGPHTTFFAGSGLKRLAGELSKCVMNRSLRAHAAAASASAN